MSENSTAHATVVYEWFTARAGPFSWEEKHRPSLPESEWRRVDARFEQLASRLDLNFHLILTNGSTEEIGHTAYVILEPMGHVVMAVGHRENKAAVWTDPTCWRDGFNPLCEEVQTLLQQDRLVEALLHAIDGAFALLSAHPAAVGWRPAGTERATGSG